MNLEEGHQHGGGVDDFVNLLTGAAEAEIE